MSTQTEVRDQLVDVFKKAWHHEDEHGAGSRVEAGIKAVLATGLVAVVEEPPAASRPYWLSDAKVEDGVYLGFTKGEWPVQAFGDVGMAGRWAAEDPERRVLIGPVPIPAHIPTLRAQKIPASVELVSE